MADTDIHRLDPTYLKRHRGQYQVRRGEDGIWYLPTRFKPSAEGLEYEVYVHDDDRLAALLPRGTALHLLRTRPDDFVKHQEADDGIVLLFREEQMNSLAKPLRLKRRRRLSPEARAAAVARLAEVRERKEENPCLVGGISARDERKDVRPGQKPGPLRSSLRT